MAATEYDEGFPADHGTDVGDEHGETPTQRRERSKIAFPYGDLAGAIDVARAVSEYGLDCDAGQLAAGLNLTSGGGMFRMRVGAAQHFDLIDSGNGRFALTPLGRRVIDPLQEAAARVEAFLHVPLYAHIYELFNGTVLPNDHGLEAEMIKAGVAQKQASKARQAFARSAEQAGFFAAGRTRLVKPGVATVTPEPKQETPSLKHGKEADPLSDPMLAGLLRRMLPAEGKEFSARDRRLFFTALAVNLDVIYGSPTDGAIDADEVAKLYKLTTVKGEPPSAVLGTHA